jgi:medium-chain acyl-[acyl-carrier-protein] hydrolase
MGNARMLSAQNVCRIGHNPKASLRVYCFPYAGGSAHIFETWRKHLPASVEVASVELRGRGRRSDEELVSRFDRHVEEIIADLLSHPEMETVLFGHSMGALIAFEVARAFRAAGRRLPRRLYVSGHRAPHLPDNDPTLHACSDAVLIDRLRDWKGTPEEVLGNPKMLSLLLPILRADLAAAAGYRYRLDAPLECPVVAFGGRQDAEASPDELSAWSGHTTSTFDLHLFKGDHFFIQDPASGFMEHFRQDLGLICAEIFMRTHVAPSDGTPFQDGAKRPAIIRPHPV